VTLRRTTEHFGHGIQSVIQDEIKLLWKDHADLDAEIDKPRSNNKTNVDRLFKMDRIRYRIADLERIASDYVDKKPIKTREKRYSWGSESTRENRKESLIRVFLCDKSAEKRRKALKILTKPRPNWPILENDDLSNVTRLKQYFKKSNGALNRHDFFEVYQSISSYRVSVPESLNKLKIFLGVNTLPDLKGVLKYSHILSTIGMLPDQDSQEYADLMRWKKRMRIESKTFNILDLERLHAYLINRLNRKNYTAREPKKLPVNEKLLKIESAPGLTLIKTDKDLRAEGRRQSHCIGSKQYINQCFRGYQALNYKGYTYFLSPELRVQETHGRHNCGTPREVTNELVELIGRAA